MTARHVEPGMLLAAWPDLLDPNFMHRVVLMGEHTEESAFGLVTNQATDVCLGDLFPDNELLAGSEFPVFCGGPVDSGSLHFVHTCPEEFPGSLELNAELALGGDLDGLAQFVSKHGMAAQSRLRVFIGYAGWGAGQLDLELEHGSWVPAPPSLEHTFGEAGERTWRRVVRGMNLNDLAVQPPDTSWN